MADLLLIGLLVGAFVLGYLRGAVRQLIIVGAGLVVFFVAAYLRPLVGDFIAGNAPQFAREYIDMLAFLSTFLLVFLLVVLVVELRGATVQLTQRVIIDEVLGGVLAVGWMLLAIASVAIALDSFYALDRAAGAEEVELVRELAVAFERSEIVRALHNGLIPGMVALLGPLLPDDIRAVYG